MLPYKVRVRLKIWVLRKYYWPVDSPNLSNTDALGLCAGSAANPKASVEGKTQKSTHLTNRRFKFRWLVLFDPNTTRGLICVNRIPIWGTKGPLEHRCAPKIFSPSLCHCQIVFFTSVSSLHLPRHQKGLLFTASSPSLPQAVLFDVSYPSGSLTDLSLWCTVCWHVNTLYHTCKWIHVTGLCNQKQKDVILD